MVNLYCYRNTYKKNIYIYIYLFSQNLAVGYGFSFV